MKSAGELILYKDFNGTDEEIFYPMARSLSGADAAEWMLRRRGRSSTSVFIDC